VLLLTLLITLLVAVVITLLVTLLIALWLHYTVDCIGYAVNYIDCTFGTLPFYYALDYAFGCAVDYVDYI